MRCVLFLLVVLGLTAVPEVRAQSAGGAFVRSLVLPGWGHHYAHGGRWGKSGTFFAGADAAMLLGASSAEWRRGSAVESYRTLATGRAGAEIAGKDRTFFLRLASYRSSDEFREVSLRNRAWDDVDYVADPAFQWEWQSEADYLEFRELREESESLRRRRTVLVATLVANRLISGLSAARAARRGSAGSVTLSVTPEPGIRLSLGL